MSRKVIATTLFQRHLKDFLDEYAELGAVRFVESLWSAFREMLDNISKFGEIGPARKRTVNGKVITLREYVLNARSRDFLVVYTVPSDPEQPILLINIRIGGQNRFKWN